MRALKYSLHAQVDWSAIWHVGDKPLTRVRELVFVEHERARCPANVTPKPTNAGDMVTQASATAIGRPWMLQKLETPSPPLKGGLVAGFPLPEVSS